MKKVLGIFLVMQHPLVGKYFILESDRSGKLWAVGLLGNNNEFLFH